MEAIPLTLSISWALPAKREAIAKMAHAIWLTNWHQLLVPFYLRLSVGPLRLPHGIVVRLLCHNQIPQTGWLHQQKFISSEFQRLQVQDQSVGKVDVIWRLSLQRVASRCPHFFLCACPTLVSLPLPIRTSVILD